MIYVLDAVISAFAYLSNRFVQNSMSEKGPSGVSDQIEDHMKQN